MRIISKTEFDDASSYTDIFIDSGFNKTEVADIAFKFLFTQTTPYTQVYEDYVNFMQPYTTKLNTYLTSTEET
jgi:hypothetical protein